MGTLVLGLGFPVQAKGDDPENLPDMALLEFLGSWESETGEWIDPMFFEDGADKGQGSSEEQEAPGKRPVSQGGQETLEPPDEGSLRRKMQEDE